MNNAENDSEDLRENQKQYYSSSDSYKDSLVNLGLNKYLEFYTDLFTEYVTPGGLILDLGCGAGSSTRYLKTKGFEAIGLDISYLFLSTADNQSTSPAYTCASAEHIPFADNIFDAIGANSFIEHVPNVHNVLNEMVRVTKPGGKIIFNGPNLLSPLVPLVKAIKSLTGQKISPVYGNGFFSCIATSFRNASILRQKKNAKHTDIIYRKPLLNDDEFTADDADSTWLANRHDLMNILTDLGCKIIISQKEFPGMRTTLAKISPDALSLTLVAEK